MNRQITADPTPLDQDAEGVPRALIVDDDPVLRLAITQFVGRLGFHTESVENGQLAVEHFDAEGADIVLLDAAMPSWTASTPAEASAPCPAASACPSS